MFGDSFRKFDFIFQKKLMPGWRWLIDRDDFDGDRTLSVFLYPAVYLWESVFHDDISQPELIVLDYFFETEQILLLHSIINPNRWLSHPFDIIIHWFDQFIAQLFLFFVLTYCRIIR